MKFNVAQVALLAMALGITAAPTSSNAKDVAVRQETGSSFLNLFRARASTESDSTQSSKSSESDSTESTGSKGSSKSSHHHKTKTAKKSSHHHKTKTAKKSSHHKTKTAKKSSHHKTKPGKGSSHHHKTKPGKGLSHHHKTKSPSMTATAVDAMATGSDSSDGSSMSPQGFMTVKNNKAKSPAKTAKKAGSPKHTASKKAGSSKPTSTEEGSSATITGSSTKGSKKGSKKGGAKGAAGSSSGSKGSSAGGSLPASSGYSALPAAQTIAAGKSFDGGMLMYDRGVACTGQKEGVDKDAVFIIEEGGSISNVIIGPKQVEGIHCRGACTLKNVWWSAVCEDAFTVKTQAAGATTKIIGGGAFGASDKVIQHNGAGTISISGFTVSNFGKLYRSCGNCKTMYERHVIIDGVSAKSGKLLAGVNYNYGDSAKITNTKASSVKAICETFTGNSNGKEPPVHSTGADGKYCIYGSDVTTA